ncbi:MAG: hypothetical protein V9G23_04690 [Giesbergeria sp.]
MNSMTDAGAVESLDAKPLKLGEILFAAQKISRNDLDRALEVQRSMGARLGRLLVNLGIVSEVDVFICAGAPIRFAAGAAGKFSQNQAGNLQPQHEFSCWPIIFCRWGILIKPRSPLPLQALIRQAIL